MSTVEVTSATRSLGTGPASQVLVRRWITQVRRHSLTVAFADGEDPRVVDAAIRLWRHTGLQSLLVGRADVIEPLVAARHRELPTSIEIVDTTRDWRRREVEHLLRTKMAEVGQPSAFNTLVEDPLYFSASLVDLGYGNAYIGGCLRPTRDVLRVAIRVTGLADVSTKLTSCFLMFLRGGRVIVYADCAVLPDPTATELAIIASATARTFKTLTREQPVVAMLSFSTKGSASHESVKRVRRAVEILRRQHPHLTVDGEMQFDAAWVAEIGHRKAPDSEVTGRANIFIFPNLDAANIGYKITEHLAGARAIGPILQGSLRPVADSSRGSSVSSIQLSALAVAVQALDPPKRPNRAMAR